MDGVDDAGEGLEGGEFGFDVGDERGADGVDALHDGAGEGHGWRLGVGSVGGDKAAEHEACEPGEVPAFIREDVRGGGVAGERTLEDERDEL